MDSRLLNTGDLAMALDDVSLCSHHNASKKQVVFDANPRYFVRGVRVCTSGQADTTKRRLKGIRIYPARVTLNGTITSLNNYDGDQRNNCDVWHSPVYCLSGHIAHKLIVHHRDGDFITGLALSCKRVIDK